MATQQSILEDKLSGKMCRGKVLSAWTLHLLKHLNPVENANNIFNCLKKKKAWHIYEDSPDILTQVYDFNYILKFFVF